MWRTNCIFRELSWRTFLEKTRVGTLLLSPMVSWVRAYHGHSWWVESEAACGAPIAFGFPLHPVTGHLDTLDPILIWGKNIIERQTSLDSWSLAKERCLTQPSTIPPTASFWLIHHSYLCFSIQMVKCRVCRQEVNALGVTWQAVGSKWNSTSVSNEQSHVLCLYCFHSLSQVFQVWHSGGKLAHLMQ